MYVPVAEGACQSSASQKWAKEKKNWLVQWQHGDP